MAVLKKSIFINVFFVLTVQGWPMQNMNNPPPQPQSWPWMPNNEADKPIDMPKSMSYPIPSNGGMSNFDSSSMNQQSKPFPPQGGLQGGGPQSGSPAGWQGGPSQPEMWAPNSPPDQMMNQDAINQMNGGGDDFPHNRPYRNYQMGQGGQQYPMMMPPPMSMGNNNHPMHGGMPPPRAFGGQGGGMSSNRVGGRSSNSPPEFFPQSSPFDFLNPRYPIEYSPLKQKNTSVPAITIHYNVTYTFSALGWKPIDVAVSDADFHSSISDRAVDFGMMGGMPLMTPGGGIMPAPQNEMKNSPEPGPISGSWWPKKSAGEIDDKAPSGMNQPEIKPL